MAFLLRIFKIFIAFIGLCVVAISLLLVFGPISNPKAIIHVIFGSVYAAPDQNTIQTRLKVPSGFSIGVYAKGLKKVRMLEFTNSGDLLASQPRDGNVLLLKRDTNQDGRSDSLSILIGELKRPHGLAFYEDWLYIAESNAIGRVKFNHDSGQIEGDYQRIIEGLTDDGNHWTKSIRINGAHLYVSLGSTCNVCEEDDERRATIMKFDLDGSNGGIYATGLRNSVGLDFAPWSNTLYATDNGRDLLGDDYPVCELNKIEEGNFYGWPYINGFGDLDPDLGKGQELLLNQAVSPSFGFSAHNAPLGLRFIRTASMPESFQKAALVALHGSWNRSEADGYKVVSLHWQNDGQILSRDFLSGFELNGDIIGRPVDIAEGPDGCVFVSDDYTGVIYRVCYGLDQTILPEAISVIEDNRWAEMSDIKKTNLRVKGEDLYQSYSCANCHAFKKSGNTNGKALSELSRRYTLQSLSEYFLSPNPPMPQFVLSEDEREQLSAYLLYSTQ